MKLIVSALLVVCCSVGVMAQDILLWGNDTNGTFTAANGPDGSAIPGSTDSAVGALVQVIKNSQTAPNVVPWVSTGVGGTDVLVTWSWTGKGGEGDGLIADSGLFTTLGIGTSDDIFVRVWSEASANPASGWMPNPVDYGIGDGLGGYYYDAPLVTVSGLALGGGFYQYDIPDIGQNDWTFVAIPEPTTVGLAALGLIAMLVRKIRK